MGCTVDKESTKTVISEGNSAHHHENIPHLTDTQKVIIQKNWQTLKLHIANIGVITYVSMFESRPELITAFSKFKGKDVSKLHESGLLQQHALRVMATIDKCITRIDQPSSMIYMLREVGFHHRNYSVEPDDIQIILPHFLSAMKPYVQETWCDELEDAWITFLSIVFHHMRDGMQETYDHSTHIHETVISDKTDFMELKGRVHMEALGDHFFDTEHRACHKKPEKLYTFSALGDRSQILALTECPTFMLLKL